MMIRRVVCGISGGVDSAVAAALLKRANFEVIGAYMENWDEHEEYGSCSMQRQKDIHDAQATCRHLKIPFVQISFVKEYWNEVFTRLLYDYSRGLTPNPDVLCNRHLKFGAFYEYAVQKLGADAIATGHYARSSYGPFLENATNTVPARLKRAVDASKDQTLFLSTIEQTGLRRTMFPLGELYKSHVRELAYDLGLNSVAKKRDSVGICFIGDRSFQDFISQYLPDQPGYFVDVDSGNVIGKHTGVHKWTIGQRCKITGYAHAFYVAARDYRSRLIFAALGHDHNTLYSSIVWTETMHWLSDAHEIGADGFSCTFKFQHKEWNVPVVLYPDGTCLKVLLSFPTRAISPGQQAVFYKNDECVGSAKILWSDALEKINQTYRNFDPNLQILQYKSC